MSAGVRLERRYHPDGSTLYDVWAKGFLCKYVPFLGSPRLGVVRQHPGKRGWFAYGPTDTEPSASSLPRRSDAVEVLVDRLRSSGER